MKPCMIYPVVKSLVVVVFTIFEQGSHGSLKVLELFSDFQGLESPRKRDRVLKSPWTVL